MREQGYLRLAVPVELGGLGASMRQVCYAQAELAKHCASALAVNMHLYLVLANAYRWRHGAPVEGVLRRVADDGIVLMTSGGSDGIWPSRTAVRDNGGFRVSGRKMFCSQAPIADVLVTMAAYDDPEEGTMVLLMGIPTTSEGFQVVETWDTLGMRATASHDVQLDDVKVSDAQIVARRPWGKVDPALRNAGVHFAPPVAAVYFGVAAAARDEAVRVVCDRRSGDGHPLAQDATSQRLVGLMDHKLKVAWWSLAGALGELGEDYTPDEAALELVMLAKRQVVPRRLRSSAGHGGRRRLGLFPTVTSRAGVPRCPRRDVPSNQPGEDANLCGANGARAACGDDLVVGRWIGPKLRARTRGRSSAAPRVRSRAASPS